MLTRIERNRIRRVCSFFLVIILFLASLPIQAVQASDPPVEPEVTAQRIGDLPIGTKIRDSVNWDYFTSKEPGWNPTVKDVQDSPHYLDSRGERKACTKHQPVRLRGNCG